MNNKQLLEYLVAGKLANMAYTIAEQAKYARNAEEITQEQYVVLLTVMSRVHTAYSIQMDKIEDRATASKNTNRAMILVILAGFSIAMLLTTIMMWGMYG